MKIRLSALSGILLCAISSAWGSSAAAVTISPSSITLNEGASQQFQASVSSTWKTTCGSISSSGLYKAPLYEEGCTITATAGSQQATAKVTVKTPIVMTPRTIQTPQGNTQQFTASIPVTWHTKCGSISASGLYSASGSVGQQCSIWAIAASGPAYTVYGWDQITASGPPPPALSISPASANLLENGSQQFTASAASTWTASCGSISSSGLYQANLYEGSCTVTATAGSQKATATVAVMTPIVMTPRTVLTPQGQTQQFMASVPVKWNTRCGSISASGLYTASGSVGQQCSTWAVATSGPAYTVYGWDRIGAPGSLSLYPASITVAEGASQQFTAGSPASWSASCGSVSSSGLFNAPLAPGACAITATAMDGSGRTATGTANVAASSITLTPASLHTHALGKQHFTASIPVTWSSTCGAIDSGGNFTAPATEAPICSVTAQASSGAAYTAQAPVLVTMVNYVTWKNGNARDGLQPDEQILSPANVNANSFGPVWNATLDGSFWDQPLYMNGLAVNGTPRNVLFVGTSNDSLYALDADTGAQLWKTSLLPSGATAVTGSSVNSSISQLGILGTPAIDPDAQTIYAVAETAESSGTKFVHRLHALDVTTGHERPGSPVLITDPAMPPVHKLQRPGLLLANHQVYVAFGSVGDIAPYHGLLFAFDAGTLAQTAVFNVTATGSEGALWNSGGAPSADADGNIYVSTGNGDFDGATNFGQAVVKLSPALKPLDYFAPYDYVANNKLDLDLGSGGVLLTPAQSGPYTHEIIVCGKTTPIFVLNRDSLGHVGTNSDNIIQRLDHQLGGTATARQSGEPCFSTPAMWQQHVYFVANGDVVKMFNLDPMTGLLSTTPVAQGTHTYGYPGAQAVVSTGDNKQQGILWANDYGAGTLLAYDAVTLQLLYQSPTQDTSVKWAVPTVANGHVYVGYSKKIVAFGTH